MAKRLLPQDFGQERQASYVEVRDADSGELIDRAVAVFYRGPRSYTGEDLVELAVHGGYLVPGLVLAALLRAGARQALPGEFTRRAVVAGKLDLLQAEAVGDLVDARSQVMHQAALRQLDGSLSREISRLRESMLELEALIAYDIDFPEEDEGPLRRERVADGVESVLSSLDRLLATSSTGAVVREGAVVVIAGPPNVGKSSLFNALVGENRAIVTEVAGTTRDAIEAVVEIGRWPVRLVDTAGLRETSDVVERLGIEVSERYLASAELVLALGDAPDVLADATSTLVQRTLAPVLPVLAKVDLRPPSESAMGVTRVSVVTRQGLGELIELIRNALERRHGSWESEAPLLLRERHRRAISLARQEVVEFRSAWEDGVTPAPVAAVHLRTAVGALEELIGAVDAEDVLERVFRTFCVGK